MAGGWIDEFKRAVTVHVVFPALGMTDRGHKRWTPCPACGKEKLSDGRAPVGVSARGGWECHQCGAKGDALSALCWKTTGKESPSSEGWEQTRQAAVQHGWIRDAGPPASGRVRPLATAVGKRPAPSAPPTTPEETPQEVASTRGAFRWRDDLPDRCAVPLANLDAAGFAPGSHEEWVCLKVGEYLTEYRGLSVAVILDAKLGVLLDEAGKPVLDGERPWLTIPLADKAGRFVNVHFRRVPIPGTCEDCDALGRWRECEACRKGKKGFPRYKLCGGRPTPLYGADRLTPRKGAVARVTEGEFDVLALRTYGLGENAVSGTAGAGTFADDWLDSLEPFDSVYLCYDADDAGQKGAGELAEKLGRYKCGRVTFPHKDVGDCLIAKVQPDVIRRAFEVADSYVDVKLRKANEFRDALDALIETPNLLKGVSTTSEVLDTAFGGWSNGLIVVTGESGSGKTTLTTWQLWALARAGHTVAITSFEQQPIMTVLQLLSMELGGDPTERTREERSEAMDRLTALPLYIVDHYGQMPYTKLEEALKYAVRRCGVRYILVDHLGFLVSPEAEDERRAIEAVIRSLVLLRKDMDVTLFLIVHPRNDPDASKKWGRVTMQHLKGASAIRQDADMVLVVTRELPNQVKGRMCPKDKPRPWPQARIYIDKKRGRFGAVSGAGEVVLAFDPKSQVFADTWAQTPMGKTGALMDAVNTETPDEGDEPKPRGSRKAGTSGRGRGRKTRETHDF